MARRAVPTLVLFCGLPGSGKTTLAKTLEVQGRGVRICTDDWQEALGVDHSDDEFHGRLQSKLYEHALELLEHGQDVILEDGLWRASEREAKLADAHQRGAITEIHVFDVPVDEVWARLERRNRSLAIGAVPIVLEEFDRICRLFEPPGPAELARFDHYEIHRP